MRKNAMQIRSGLNFLDGARHMESPKSIKPSAPKFPRTICNNGRNFVTRGELEKYKADLISFATGGECRPVDLAPHEINALVPFKEVADELGTGRRTIGRRVKEKADSEAAACELPPRGASRRGSVPRRKINDVRVGDL
jgi:hypothetical protein